MMKFIAANRKLLTITCISIKNELQILNGCETYNFTLKNAIQKFVCDVKGNQKQNTKNSFNFMQIIQCYKKMKLILQLKCISVW